MKKRVMKPAEWAVVFAAILLILFAVSAEAGIDGISGINFNLTVKTDSISTPDGGSILIWGYMNGDDRAQYPGPTLIVNQGFPVTVNLTNNLTVAGSDPAPNVSILFPGQQVTASGGTPGLLTNEAAPGGTDTVTYTFTASHAGTFMYHSGTNPELQVEMGLIGAIIVRPSAGAGFAYNHPDTRFDQEYLFLLSEMDLRIHQTVEFHGLAALEGTDYLSSYFPVYWFINGRAAPDTMAKAGAGWLVTQPYNCRPRMHPGEKMLMRVIGAGRDLHPYHHHGSHSRIIARDGRLLESAPGEGSDLSHEVFTIPSVPGETVDAIFEWTGKGLGWDMYGTADQGGTDHECTDLVNNETLLPGSDGFADPGTMTAWEYCPDHEKPFPVVLPDNLDLAFGGFWSGSPFLGASGSLPPGEGGLNPYNGFAYMWHSHTEKEMTNNDIFPGGMMTMMIIEPPGAPIP